MAYNQELAQRVREVLAGQPGLVEKKMFGGAGFMLRGNLACGVLNDDLIVRVGPERYEQALRRPLVRPFDITGRAMKGWVMVASTGIFTDQELQAWVTQGVDFALSLPSK